MIVIKNTDISGAGSSEQKNKEEGGRNTAQGTEHTLTGHDILFREYYLFLSSFFPSQKIEAL